MRRRAVPAALALVSLLAGCTVFDPMQQQQKEKPYRRNPFYADGLAMRTPPEGTLPREVPVALPLVTGGGPAGKLLDRIPVPVTRQLVETGRKRYEIVCAACHGLLGDGQSAVARNMSLRPPPSLHQFRQFPDGWYYQVVSLGFGLMPSYAAELPVEERWAIVAYVRALQLSQAAALGQVPPAERRRLEEERP